MSATEQIFSAGGKRMRPASMFLVSRAIAEIAGLMELTKEHRRLVEIIEMIHTASLIHDDVLDESDMHRGKEAVHQLFGTRVAMLAGDFMFAKSSWYLANLEVIKLISQVLHHKSLKTLIGVHTSLSHANTPQKFLFGILLGLISSNGTNRDRIRLTCQFGHY
ncbi:hypothetical protein HYC85_012985 [Camellia sinensis]|uniref:Uncharacterized protein n=1 Tax=Camellia sinensis TaxID=4442 RepID=A0A7J7HDJ6_CAMSI|nr:hypothetical protein HYC85_012985 [Camellia sinensis]